MLGRLNFVLVVAATAICCLGCHSDIQYVYVDPTKAIDATVGPAPPSPQIDVKTAPPTITAFKIAASPAVTEGKTTAAGAAKVRASIAANRDKTYRTIVRRLHDAYAREADNLRTLKLAEFGTVKAALTASAMKKVSEAYVKYADAVGPKIAKLAINAGFPDPDKLGRRKPSGIEGLDTLAYETSQQLRSEIATLKADFKRYSDTTLRAADADVDAKLTELLASVDRQVGDIDARAQDVASKEVSQAQAQLGSLLADRPPTPLPAIPESSVVVSSGSLTQPGRAALGGGPAVADDLEKVKRDLQIWLAVNKYVLRGKRQGRDATPEFIAWRNRFRLAPLAQR